jgi:hypothetical protein
LSRVPKIHIATALAVLVLVITALAISRTARAQSEQSAEGLVGVWWVSVSVYDCDTQAPRGRFTSMLLFARGGTLTETTSNPAFLPGQRGVGLGTWSRNDDGNYSARDVAFILFAGFPFQPGTQKLTHTITLSHDRNQWTDQAIVDFYDAAANPISQMHACATATANRM